MVATGAALAVLGAAPVVATAAAFLSGTLTGDDLTDRRLRVGLLSSVSLLLLSNSTKSVISVVGKDRVIVSYQIRCIVLTYAKMYVLFSLTRSQRCRRKPPRSARHSIEQ